MFVKEQLLRREVTHHDYYAQFVDVDVLEVVLARIGDWKIMASEDPVDFSDIHIDIWDKLTHNKIVLLKEKDIVKARDYITRHTTIQIAKAAARIIRETLEKQK